MKNINRNSAIFLAVLNGKTYRDVAQEFGLSLSFTTRIVEKMKRMMRQPYRLQEDKYPSNDRNVHDFRKNVDFWTIQLSKLNKEFNDCSNIESK